MKTKLNKVVETGQDLAASEFDRGVVASWLQARVEAAPDTRLRAVLVWPDFAAWCLVSGKANIGKRHFWRVMRERGLYGKHSGQTWCFGIALRPYE